MCTKLHLTRTVNPENSSEKNKEKSGGLSFVKLS